MASRKRCGKILHSDASDIVYNVIKYFDEEKNLKRYHPLKYSAARAAMATNLSRATISKIKKEGQLAEQTNTKLRTPSKGRKGKNNTRVPMENFDI
ncbi:unnamed protein product [Parnassius apollo]|uniref:(apollo) hypothetical protein n=1 Tax=Parnassius apollo TaxID=110799 RepID=A0A8S3X0R1_PARAO|nr:unnamed protein product [Parnassius apollo]